MTVINELKKIESNKVVKRNFTLQVRKIWKDFIESGSNNG
jgi:hypothetical protein